MGSIPDQGTKIPHASLPESQKHKADNIVANSVKTLKMVHIKKNSWKELQRNFKSCLGHFISLAVLVLLFLKLSII